MSSVGEVILLIFLGVLVAIAGPLIVAWSLVALFALPFWPSFCLAFGVSMLTSVANIRTD